MDKESSKYEKNHESLSNEIEARKINLYSNIITNGKKSVLKG
jgi:hypothetical protein